MIILTPAYRFLDKHKLKMDMYLYLKSITKLPGVFVFTIGFLLQFYSISRFLNISCSSGKNKFTCLSVLHLFRYETFQYLANWVHTPWLYCYKTVYNNYYHLVYKYAMFTSLSVEGRSWGRNYLVTPDATRQPRFQYLQDVQLLL